MVNTINMQEMRHLNLFGKVTQVRTRFCFRYNEGIIFCVPKSMLSKAIGEGGRNVRKMSEILGRKIKIIPAPRGIEDAPGFIEAVVSPVTFKEIQLTDDELILTAGSQSKAALIGRNKRRLLELQKVVKDFFKKDLRIV